MLLIEAVALLLLRWAPTLPLTPLHGQWQLYSSAIRRAFAGNLKDTSGCRSLLDQAFLTNITDFWLVHVTINSSATEVLQQYLCCKYSVKYRLKITTMLLQFLNAFFFSWLLTYFWWSYVLQGMTCATMSRQKTLSMAACLQFLVRPTLPRSYLFTQPSSLRPFSSCSGFELHAILARLLFDVPDHRTLLALASWHVSLCWCSASVPFTCSS